MIDQPWWFRMFAVWVALIHGLIALACFFGPERWFTSSSLTSLHSTIPIPWAVYGTGYAFVAVGLMFAVTRLAAYFVGFLLCGWFVMLSIYFTIFANEIRNPFISFLVLLAPLVLLAGVRYAAATVRTRR